VKFIDEYTLVTLQENGFHQVKKGYSGSHRVIGGKIKIVFPLQLGQHEGGFAGSPGTGNNNGAVSGSKGFEKRTQPFWYTEHKPVLGGFKSFNNLLHFTKPPVLWQNRNKLNRFCARTGDIIAQDAFDFKFPGILVLKTLIIECFLKYFSHTVTYYFVLKLKMEWFCGRTELTSNGSATEPPLCRPSIIERKGARQKAQTFSRNVFFNIPYYTKTVFRLVPFSCP
jgi:hypothetical protein